jgi:iodotyrosine deiodinase
VSAAASGGAVPRWRRILPAARAPLAQMLAPTMPLPQIPYEHVERQPEEMAARARAFYEEMARRRSVRDFSDRPVPRELIEYAIRTAGTAPSGAHMQPWTFVAVSDPDVKRQIRLAAEEEERASYEGRMPDEWLAALEPLGTDWRKPFLETAPWLVVLFAQRSGIAASGERRKHYYVQESCGIASGLFIAALHTMGLATLTHTPSPMGFLREVLGRPDNEAPFILFPVGYPAGDARVPDMGRKPLAEIAVWHPER